MFLGVSATSRQASSPHPILYVLAILGLFSFFLMVAASSNLEVQDNLPRMASGNASEAASEAGRFVPVMTQGGDIKRFTFLENEEPVNFGRAFSLWQNDSAFRESFIEVLAGSQPECGAFFWECAPTAQSKLSSIFEFVLVPAPSLARVQPEQHAFGGRLDSCAEPALTFDNLGRDATLIAPCPNDGVEHTAYSHIAAFTRSAPRAQQHAFWQQVGAAVTDRINKTDQTIWLSTSGLGVYWLHVRVDRTPKYYTYQEFRKPVVP